MSFPRYPKYKASGVEWLGDVPEGWEVKPVRQLATVVNGFPFDSKLFDAAEGIPLIRIRDLNQAVTDTCYKGEFIERAAITSDDVLIGMDGDFNVGRWRGNGRALLNQRMCCIRGKSRLLTRLLEYSLPIPLKAINEVTYATTVKHLASSQIEKTFVTLPPTVEEQTAIAEFLDRETGKIDELVAEQRRLMDLLKEKRQAVISHAVTGKGEVRRVKDENGNSTFILQPSSLPKKPSGIEWLGDVPEHWEVKPLRSVFKFSKGLTITKEDLRDEGVYCVNYGEIHSKYGFRLKPDIHPLRCVEPKYLSSNPDALIRDGDFVFADTSEDLEGSGNFTHLRSENPIFAGYHTIIGRPRKGINSLLLAYQIHSSAFRSQIQRQVKGVKVFSISQGILKAAKCLLPPLPEQTAIAEFLETELSKFDTLTAEAQRAIALLQERRTALISVAVTGQIDVRGGKL